jgi:hypothetical protein
MARSHDAEKNEDKCNIAEDRKESLKRMLFRRNKDNKWLGERTGLMLSYLDFAYDKAVSDSVRFRALERFADLLDRSGEFAEGGSPDPLPGEIGSRLEALIARAGDVAIPALRAILHLAQSRDVSDSVRLRALEKILAALERSDDHDSEHDERLPDEWERALRRFENDLCLGTRVAPAPGAESGRAAEGRVPAVG